jgi:hypothetical protein
MRGFAMTTRQVTHFQRERAVITDLENSFPDFTGHALSWAAIPNGQDPPDFISHDGPKAPVGLELIEWLDGDQMGPAKIRESQREQAHRVLTHDWKKEYRPRNFRGAFPSLLGAQKIVRADELPLRDEFFACAAEVDRTWADSDHRGDSYYQIEFDGYPLLKKYFNSINYIGGEPHGSCWIGQDGDGGAFDPFIPVESLKKALDNKLSDYCTAEKQMHLKHHALLELDLLVHGGFNKYAYNTPAGHLSLGEIAQRGADHYAIHAQRHIFDRVWLFDSLDSADDVNELVGLAPGTGRVRWLAQLWPEFVIFQ